MKIASFGEYTGVLREIYTGEAMAETGNYYYALMSSGKRLNQKKVTHRLSRWFFTSGCNPNGASERLKGV